MKSNAVAFSPMPVSLIAGSTLLDGGVPDFFKKTVYVRHAQSLEHLFSEMYAEALNDDAYAVAARGSLMRLVLIGVLRQGQRAVSERSLIFRIKEVVAEHPRANNMEIARRLSYHPYYLNEIFKKNEGVCLHKYVMRLRLMRARELICASARSYEEIAAECGFSSASHLCRAIGKEYGITPSKMRKM